MKKSVHSAGDYRKRNGNVNIQSYSATTTSSSNAVGKNSKVKIQLKKLLEENQPTKSHSMGDCTKNLQQETHGSDVEVVIFEARANKGGIKKAKRKLPLYEAPTSDEGVPFSLREAMFEVRKFGIKGLEKDDKEKAKTQLLIRLGAKAPKNKYYNYPEYQELRKRQVETEILQAEQMRRLGFKTRKPRKKRKKNKNDILPDLDAPIGQFKGGSLTLNRVTKHKLLQKSKRS